MFKKLFNNKLIIYVIILILGIVGILTIRAFIYDLFGIKTDGEKYREEKVVNQVLTNTNKELNNKINEVIKQRRREIAIVTDTEKHVRKINETTTTSKLLLSKIKSDVKTKKPVTNDKSTGSKNKLNLDKVNKHTTKKNYDNDLVIDKQQYETNGRIISHAITTTYEKLMKEIKATEIKKDNK